MHESSDIPDLEIHTDVWRRLMVVLAQEHEELQLLKLHLFTEQLLHQMLATYLRASEKEIGRLRLGYARKVDFVEVAHLVGKDGCSLLRKLNRLRQKLAHELNYTITTEERKSLTEGIAQNLDRELLGGSVFRRLAPFLGGYLSGGMKLSKLVAQKIGDIRPEDIQQPPK